MSNTRKRKWYVVLVSTDEEKEEMIFVIDGDRDANAKANAVKQYRKNFSEENFPELFVTIIYKSYSAQEADIFYKGFLAGRMED